MKKLFLLLLLLFGCEDAIVEEPMSMKLWLNGEEVDVAAEYQRISAFAEQTEYTGFDTTKTFLKKILVIHFQKDAGRLELSKEHYAVVFTDWEGDTTMDYRLMKVNINGQVFVQYAQELVCTEHQVNG